MNKTIRLLLIIITIAAVCGCRSYKESLVTSFDDKEKAIQNAILDFSHTERKLYNQDNVFIIRLADTAVQYGSRKDLDEIYRPIEISRDEHLLAITLSGVRFKYPLTSETIPGNEAKIPSRFIEDKGKLFLWYDDSKTITEELITVYKKYNLFEPAEVGQFLEFASDDAKKAISYYFCRNNLFKYKKQVSNVAREYLEIPKLNCDRNKIE